MSKAKDFSDDLAIVSKAVKTDVDAIIKLVREKDEWEGDASPSMDRAGQGVSPVAASETQSTPPKPIRQRPSRMRTVITSTPDEVVVLENVTTRLRRDTNERLTEAALRQKLKKELPASRQDIIEAALQDWFRRHGYASSDRSRGE